MPVNQRYPHTFYGGFSSPQGEQMLSSSSARREKRARWMIRNEFKSGLWELRSGQRGDNFLRGQEHSICFLAVRLGDYFTGFATVSTLQSESQFRGEIRQKHSVP